MSNKRYFRKQFARYDGNGRIIPGSNIWANKAPKHGNWVEVQAYECCNPTTTTTTSTTTPTTTTTTTLGSSSIKYGYLYNFFAVDDARGIAPDGWHVPTDTEFETLRLYVASQGWNYDGTTDVGTDEVNKQGKALATDYGWEPYEETGTVGNTDYPAIRNISGFSVLPGGGRYDDGNFNLIGYSGYWWSSTEESTGYAFYRSLTYSGPNVYRGFDTEVDGFSVRCLRDSSEGWAEGQKVQDIDGNIYDTVQIGTQIWMVQNLAVTHFKDGTPLTNVTDGTAWAALETEGYCAYDNNENNVFI